MGYENDPYMDEDGEPLMDPDAASDREFSTGPAGFDEDEGDDWRRERSPTPVLESSKQRKRLVKKVAGGRDSSPVGSPAAAFGGEDLDDWGEEQPSATKKMKVGFKESGKKEKSRPKSSDRVHGEGSKRRAKGFGAGSGDHVGESEIKELWETVAGGDSEDDQPGVRNAADDAFIDDSGVDPLDRYGSDDDDRYLREAPQAEEDDEINRLFKSGKKKKKNEKTPGEIAGIVDYLMAELEVTAEEDAELNRQNKPAINKLKKLPLLMDVLSKKNLQQEFLDRGVLALLRNWLEPLPDGSLPNMNIRTAILNILTDYPIDLELQERREQLKKSGLGKVIMFLSKTDEETTANRKLAKELVDKWSRPIFNKSTRFEDMRRFDDEKVPYKRPNLKKPVPQTPGLESGEDDLDEFSRGPKSGQGASRQHASRPEALPLDFVVRPQSKIDPDEIRARAKQQVFDQRRLKMNKKLQQLKAPKKKRLQATKVSVEGRGMVKYL